MDSVDPSTYVAVLNELTALQNSLRRLETRLLSLMNEAGITDEAIGTVLNLSSQAVNKRRRRRD